MTDLSAATPDAVAEALAHGDQLRSRYRFVIVALVVGLLASMAIALSVGSVRVPLETVWSAVWGVITGLPAATDGPGLIVWEIRAPRVIIGALVGAGLAVVGVAIQAMVRNPLADPYVLGVSSGASVGAVAVIYFGAGVLGSGPVSPALGAFVGAVLTMAVVFALARSGGRLASVRLLLVGVALSYALSGLTSFALYATHDPAAENSILFWLLGGLGGARWSQVPLVAACVAVGLAAVWTLANRLNALSLGDDSAVSLGVDPDRLRVLLFLVCSLVVAALVSVVGPIGFVGLVIPHLVRLTVGAEHRRLVPASALLGAIYLVLVDIVARTVAAPAEIPIGVLTALLGTPFFLWMIRRKDSSVLKDAL